METIEDKKLKEHLDNMEFINTCDWSYDYDIGESWSTENLEICCYDDNKEDIYFDVDVTVYKNHEEYKGW